MEKWYQQFFAKDELRACSPLRRFHHHRLTIAVVVTEHSNPLVVCSPATSSHTVVYDNGDVRAYVMSTRTVRTLPEVGLEAVDKRVAVELTLPVPAVVAGGETTTTTGSTTIRDPSYYAQQQQQQPQPGAPRRYRTLVCATVIGYEPVLDAHIVRYDEPVITPGYARVSQAAGTGTLFGRQSASTSVGSAAATGASATARQADSISVDRLLRSVLQGTGTTQAVAKELARAGMIAAHREISSGGTVASSAPADDPPSFEAVPTRSFEEVAYLPARSLTWLVNSARLPADTKLLGRRVVVFEPHARDAADGSAAPASGTIPVRLAGGFFRHGTITAAQPVTVLTTAIDAALSAPLLCPISTELTVAYDEGPLRTWTLGAVTFGWGQDAVPFTPQLPAGARAHAGVATNGDAEAVLPLSPPSPSRVGLLNMGATCWLGAAVQCLSHATPLTIALLDEALPAALHTRATSADSGARSDSAGSGLRGRMALAYADLLKSLWGGQDALIAALTNAPPGTTATESACGRPELNLAVSPGYVKALLTEWSRQFVGLGQQDAHEGLLSLLDLLHEDLAEPATVPRPTLGPPTDDSAQANNVRLGAQSQSPDVSATSGAASIASSVRVEAAINGLAEPVPVPIVEEAAEGGALVSVMLVEDSAVDIDQTSTAPPSPTENIVTAGRGEAERPAITTGSSAHAADIVSLASPACMAAGTHPVASTSTSASAGAAAAGRATVAPPPPQLSSPLVSVVTTITCKRLAPAAASTASEPAQSRVALPAHTGSPDNRAPVSRSAPPQASYSEPPSIIRRLFFAHTTTEVTCPKRHTKLRHGPASGELLPPLPVRAGKREVRSGGIFRRKVTARDAELSDCLGDYFSPESETSLCEACGHGRPVTLTARPWLISLPPILIVQLKRFEYLPGVGSHSKIQEPVHFPLALDMGPYLLPPERRKALGMLPMSAPLAEERHAGTSAGSTGETTTEGRGGDRNASTGTSSRPSADASGARYELFACLMHSGGAGSGHYTAYARRLPIGKTARRELAALRFRAQAGQSDSGAAASLPVLSGVPPTAAQPAGLASNGFGSHTRTDSDEDDGKSPAAGAGRGNGVLGRGSSGDSRGTAGSAIAASNADGGRPGAFVAGNGTSGDHNTGAATGTGAASSWALFDDGAVSRAAEKDVLSPLTASLAYLLFYARVES